MLNTKWLMSGVVACATLALPAMAAVTPINDRWDPMDPNDELSLYEIYNELYNTNFTSTNGAEGDGGMDHLFVEEQGIFGLGAQTDGSAEFVARYAGFEQRFGYYTNPGGAPTGDPSLGVDDGDFHHLFDVVNPGNTVNPMGSATIPVGDFPIGFYDNAPLGGDRTWYSDQDQNDDGLDHLVVFRGMVNGEISDNVFIIAFEDRRGLGDYDYNDLVVEVYMDGFIPPPPGVPEPASAGLLLLGLTGVALRRRFMA